MTQNRQQLRLSVIRVRMRWHSFVTVSQDEPTRRDKCQPPVMACMLTNVRVYKNYIYILTYL